MSSFAYSAGPNDPTLTPTSQGYIPFKPPNPSQTSSDGKPYQTFYKIWGKDPRTAEIESDDVNDSERSPLVVLHGGPGFLHNYTCSFGDLSISRTGEGGKEMERTVIAYDQLGCGNSTHLPHTNGNQSFWTVQLFLDELQNVLEYFGLGGKERRGYSLAGHSWGGMLAAEHASLQPPLLQKLLLCSAPADIQILVREANKLRDLLPKEIQDTLLKHENEGTTESEKYAKANDFFESRHVCRLDPLPQSLQESAYGMMADRTVYLTMNGPSEFHIVGTIRNWSMLSRIHHISVPTLITHGKHDEVNYECIKPWLDGIGRREAEGKASVQYVCFENSAHTAHLEERGLFMAVLDEFLRT